MHEKGCNPSFYCCPLAASWCSYAENSGPIEGTESLIFHFSASTCLHPCLMALLPCPLLPNSSSSYPTNFASFVCLFKWWLAGIKSRSWHNYIPAKISGSIHFLAFPSFWRLAPNLTLSLPPSLQVDWYSTSFPLPNYCFSFSSHSWKTFSTFKYSSNLRVQVYHLG